jgi:phosphoribosylformylglycinamidine synthase
MASSEAPAVNAGLEYEIIVRLKPEVLDPEGRAIQETLARIGFASVKGLQVSKRYVLNLSGAGDPVEATALAERIAKEYLANPVSETFQIRKL